MPEISVPKVWGEKANKFRVTVPKARIVTKGEWNKPVRMENMPLAIYDNDGQLKEVITRTGRPVHPDGDLWAFKYRGEWYTSTLDSVFKYGTFRIGQQLPMKRGGSHAR